MILGMKVRLHPTKEQEQKLWQSVGTARFIRNLKKGYVDYNVGYLANT